MADYDAIVVGAGHNGLAAASVLARNGLAGLVGYLQVFKGALDAEFLKAPESVGSLIAREPGVRAREILASVFHDSAMEVIRRFFPDPGKHRRARLQRRAGGAQDLAGPNGENRARQRGRELRMVTVIGEDCIVCGACEDECPTTAIRLGDGIFVVDPGLELDEAASHFRAA